MAASTFSCMIVPMFLTAIRLRRGSTSLSIDAEKIPQQVALSNGGPFVFRNGADGYPLYTPAGQSLDRVVLIESFAAGVHAYRLASQRALATARSRLLAASAERRVARIRSYQWPPSVTTDVLAGKIRLAMTAEMVREAWGRPTRINRTITAAGVREQWVYERLGGGSGYVYVENGIVTGIQN